MAADIVEGFFKGAFDAEGFIDMDTCLSDSNTIVADATEAVEDFMKKDISDITAGLQKIANMVSEVGTAAKDCASIPSDVKKMEDIVKNFNSPAAFAWHVGKDLLVNGKDIYNDINSGISDFHSKNWNHFGQDIGNAASKILLGAAEEKMNDQQKRVAEILQGVSKEANFKFDLLDLLECIYAEDQAAIALDIGVQ
jgi:hypothetical protein